MNKETSSYITGFIISVILTFVPYTLVVHHTITGRALLITILAIAMTQLMVQVLYFLHLGRGADAKFNVYFFAGTFLTMLIVVAGSVIIISNLHSNMATIDQTKQIIDSEGIYQVGGELTGACHVLHANHVVTIENAAVSPAVTVANKCDTVTFIDKDTARVQIDFGTRRKRAPYAGLTDITIAKEHTKTITLSQTGTFQFSDNLRPTVLGALAVVDEQ